MRSVVWIRCAAAFTIALTCAAAVQAANLHLDVHYAGSYDSSFNPLPASPPAPLFAEPAPHSGAPQAAYVPGAYHQFDVFMSITGTVPGEDFQSVIFDLNLGPSVTISDFGWVGEEVIFDPPGPTPHGPVYSHNSDSGPSQTDFKAITVIASNAGGHARTHATRPGEADSTLGFPTKLGSAYVHWHGFGDIFKSWVAVTHPANVLNPWSTVNGNVGTAHPASTMTVGPRSEWLTCCHGGLFSVVDASMPPGTAENPHPGPVTAGEVLTHRFQGIGYPVGEVTWGNFGLASFTPLIPGATNPPMNAAFDPDTQIVTWDTTGFARGTYDFVVTASNAYDPYQGHLYVTIAFVPEPSALTLFVPAICSLIVIGRQRRSPRREKLR